jgi:predicted ribosomally synthesized peptide with nif11-like leader
MSTSEIERFNSDAKADPVLRDQLMQRSGTVSEVIAFASERGYSFSAADVKDYATAKGGTELDETQLDAVAGGAMGPYIIITVVLVR